MTILNKPKLLTYSIYSNTGILFTVRHPPDVAPVRYTNWYTPWQPTQNIVEYLVADW